MKKKHAGFLLAVGAVVAASFSITLVAFSNRQEDASRIVGRVIDRDTGAPLPAELSVVLRGAGGITIRHVRVSDQGSFEVPDLRPGSLLLTTKMEGYAAERQSLSIDKSESRPVEFRLLRSGRVRGGIYDSAGAPVADAQIRVIYAEESTGQGGLSASYQWEMGEVRTDATGAFAVEVHPEKEFVIEAAHPGFLADISSPFEIAQAEKRSSVKLILSRGERIQGEVRDEAGNAVAGARVQLSAGDERADLKRFISFALLEQQSLSTVTDENGRYEFNRAPAATRELIISHPKYRPLRRELQSAPDRHSIEHILKPKSLNER
jgi:protocatechuate 3,4-dioxygenase beta subunit